jgi:DNA adenine methylase
MIIKPFLKWVGGKSQILNEIHSRYPVELGISITNYVEPFIGGGAVLFDILNNYILNNIFISDTNKELIITYTTIRDNVYEFICSLNNITEEYISSDITTRKQLYYEKRNLYNSLNRDTGRIMIAALFVFLNKTCFNGIYRVNKKGKFNVPQGYYINPTIYNEENILNISNKLQNVNIQCANYKESINFINDKTFVYLDPPYRPLNKTSSFTSYTNEIFNDSSQIELKHFFDEIHRVGAKVIESNSDPKNINYDDNFFDNLYKDYNITRIECSRTINSVANKRNKISELLISNY